TRPQARYSMSLGADHRSMRTFGRQVDLAQYGIAYVLLYLVEGSESDAARAFRVEAVTALDQRAGFVKVGETDQGVLWRLDTEPGARAQQTRTEAATSSSITVVQPIVLLGAHLLASPTRASRRAARARSRIVGRSSEEPLVLPRRRDDAREDEPLEDGAEHEDADHGVESDGEKSDDVDGGEPADEPGGDTVEPVVEP